MVDPNECPAHAGKTMRSYYDSTYSSLTLGQLRSGTYVMELEEDPSEYAGKTM